MTWLSFEWKNLANFDKKKWAKRLFFDLVWSKIDSFLFGFTTFYRLWMEFYCKVKVRFPKSFHVFIRASVRWMASPWFMWYYFCALWSFEIWRVERYESFVLRAQTTTEIRGFLFDTIKRFSVSVDKRSYPGPAVYRGVWQIWRTEIQEHWSFYVSYRDASKGLLVELLELGQKSSALFFVGTQLGQNGFSLELNFDFQRKTIFF